jgi:hypothetical protein
MPMQPVAAAPGIVLSASDYASGKDFEYIPSGNTYRQGSGRWTGGQNVEFISGFAQKIAGWAQATAQTTVGIPRAICPWLDNSGQARVAIGTENHLHYMFGTTLNDITPLQTIFTGAIQNALTTTINSEIILVADTNQNLVNGDWVRLSAFSPVGGFLVNGWYQVTGRTPLGYQVVGLVQAASSGAGGGAITVGYPRINLTNPFTTAIGSTSVQVTQSNHDQLVGNFVDFSNATSVGGLVLNGEFQITTVIDANNYTFNAPLAAFSTAVGGGSVSVIYLIVVQQESNAAGIGFGGGNFGVGTYGVGLISTSVLTNGWTLSAYGQQMLAAPIGGTIYVYDPSFGGRAYPLLNAPLSMNAMFVTPERFVVALGIDGIPLRLAWADQNDYTNWTTTATNTAESGRNLIGGSYFTGGIGVRNGVSLIFTDRCVFEMQYVGTALVYNTLLIGDNCGLIDPTAVCCEGGIVYWMSDQDFWAWNGGVAALPSDDIRAFVFSNINRQSMSRCTASLNRTKRQVRFWYPSPNSSENDTGIIFQYDQSCFSTMGFGRTASCDAEIFSTPISTDVDGNIFYDETGTDANGVALPYKIQLGMTDISNGDRNADIFSFTPDFDRLSGTSNLTILTKYYPQDIEVQDGPYVLSATSQKQDLRSNGKIFGFMLSANALGANFRIGVPRLEVAPAGARR